MVLLLILAVVLLVILLALLAVVIGWTIAVCSFPPERRGPVAAGPRLGETLELEAFIMQGDEYIVKPPPSGELSYEDLAEELPAEELPAEELPADQEAAEAQPEKNKFQRMLESRKFWAALVGLGMVVLKAEKPEIPLDQEQVTNLVYVLVAYILGVALEDGLTARAIHA